MSNEYKIEPSAPAIFTRARKQLGEPVREVELTDSQMQGLLDNATEMFMLLVDGEDKGEGFYRFWVNQYFIALCKETLGRIRGKYDGKISIPGVDDAVIVYKDLLKESHSEKQFLKYLILKDENVLANELDEELKSRIEEIERKLIEMDNSDDLIGKTVSLDLGQIGPSQYEIVLITDHKVGLKSCTNPNKNIELTIEEFKTLSGIKISKDE